MELQSLIADIFVAILGGVLHFSYKKYMDRRHQKILESQYPIAGEYISKYEDEENGKTVWRSAAVTLKQKGDKITGTTSFDKTVWNLEGHLLGGYLIGRYAAESNFNDGIGTFFLKITNKGKLDGIWSGYDDSNNKVSSGRYFFTKKSSIDIKPISKRDIPRILSIAEKQLGDFYIEESSLIGDGIHGFFAVSNNKTVGFCIGKIVSAKDLLEKHPALKGRGAKSIGAADIIGFMASIAVDSDYKGRGIGDALARHCAGQLIANGAQLLAVTAWKSSKGVHVDGLVKLHDFEEILEIPQFWHESSLTHGFHCPECGAPPCNCSAVLYVKHISNI